LFLGKLHEMSLALVVAVAGVYFSEIRRISIYALK
jgi:hypothetical protein